MDRDQEDMVVDAVKRAGDVGSWAGLLYGALTTLAGRTDVLTVWTIVVLLAGMWYGAANAAAIFLRGLFNAKRKEQ